ncbi:hypothetical protein [Microbulbifer yueqingensis]|uniref:SnoaL-like domain-containing protein n=1 Tax=Microbulbifer yueqingensis TaxID=658219 RepID=A0A1G9DXB2_9GAMM|nr:hypothetical protein [Microbulbifer yueqingensis]SDK68504.1 hypothetical protein SAMN05216212_2931 [Microbulbifer yueqingensis]
MKIKIMIATFIMTFSSILYANERQENALEEINEVIEAFRVSIIEKDEVRFQRLFYDKSIPWLGVLGHKRSGTLPSQLGVGPGSYVQFISWIVSTEEEVEEKFWDIKILTDNEIASVHFKYSLHIDGYKNNWGDEAWHLVKTGDGWKISSVVYSVTKNPEPPPEKI